VLRISAIFIFIFLGGEGLHLPWIVILLFCMVLCLEQTKRGDGAVW
jgi:hypothetical protein